MKNYKVEFTSKNAWMSVKISTHKPLSTKQIRAHLASLGFKSVCLHYISGLV
jgi:hypothetical protein